MDADIHTYRHPIFADAATVVIPSSIGPSIMHSSQLRSWPPVLLATPGPSADVYGGPIAPGVWCASREIWLELRTMHRREEIILKQFDALLIG